MSKYMEALDAELRKERADITVKQYLKRLVSINDGKPFTNFKFLSDFEMVKAKIEGMGLAFSTQVSYFTAICAVLSLKKGYKKLYLTYQEYMIKQAESLKKNLAKHEKTDQQKTSMIPLVDVVKRREELKEVIHLSTYTSKDWDKYLMYLLICLYTYIQPRRNQDFNYMFCTMTKKDSYEPDKNYYDVEKGEFIFNKYKTFAVYGTQVVSVPEELKKVLATYISDVCETVYSGVLPDEWPLLINSKGERIHLQNGITRLLNRAFGRNLGATAMRHIYLSDMYGAQLKKMKEDSEAMGHSHSTQAEYIKMNGGVDFIV